MIFDKPLTKRFEDVKVEGFDEPVKDAIEIGKTVFQAIEDTESVRVLKHIGNKPEVSIPASISVAKKQYSVTEIGERAFSGCSFLESVSLPDTIESIDDSAFEGCTGLAEMSIPRGVKNIRGRAFYGCSKLKKVVMKDSPETIGKSSFDGCTSLTAFTIEKGKGNFTSDSQGIMYDGDMETLIRAPFALEGTANVPISVKEIADGAFSGCSNMTSVRIPAGVKKIGDSVFSGCLKLAMLYVDPNNTRYHSNLEGMLYDTGDT